jgi:hypothetical protein
MDSKIIHFKGMLRVDGDVKSLDMDALKEYLAEAVVLDIDNENHGQLSDELEVAGIKLDWESLNA